MSLVRDTLLVAALCCGLVPVGGASAATPDLEEAPITIGVSPPRFEVELGTRGVNQSLRVFNFGTRPVDISTAVYGWDLDEENAVRLVEPDEQSLDQWFVINPLRFTIAPGESQTVRFSIRPKVEPAPGEHRAIIYFQQAPKIQDGVSVVGRMGVAVYAYAGEVERVGSLNGVRVDDAAAAPVASFDISSEGSAHVRMNGQFAVWAAPAYPGTEATEDLEDLGEQGAALPDGMLHAGFLPSVPVLPGARRSLPLALPSSLPPGSYVLDVNGDLGGRELDLAVPFTVSGSDGPRAAAN